MKKLGWAVGLLAIALTALVMVSLWWSQPGGIPTAAARFEVATSALAATESLDAEAAEDGWQLLFDQFPDDLSVALNRALNRGLWIDALTETVNNPQADDQARQIALQRLPETVARARQANDDFATRGGDPITRLWLDSRVDLQEAALLGPADGETLRQQVFAQIGDAIAASDANDSPEQARSVILAGPLLQAIDELESPATGLPTETLQESARLLHALSEQHPENLLIALRAARIGIAANLPDTVTTIGRTRDLAAAIEPLLRPSIRSIGLSPDELVDGILTAVEQGEWASAESQMNLWFNLLNSTDLVKTDRRLASPHPLDRLSFDFMRRLANELAEEQPVTAGTAAVRFEAFATGPAADTATAIAVDVTLDMRPEIVAATADGRLSLWMPDAEGNWSQRGELDLAQHCGGLLAVDLFMVDASDPTRLQVSQRRDEGTTPPPPARHTTLPTLIVFGDDGAKLLSLDGRPETADADRLSIVEGETGLESLGPVTTAIAGDLDGDGDLDLVFATRDRGLRFLINRGNRTFFELELANQAANMSALTNITALAIVDLDRDLDLDIITLDGESGTVGVIENLLHLQFRHRRLTEIPAVPGANRVHVADVDGNVSWDLIVTGESSGQITYSHTSDAGSWVVDRSETFASESVAAVAGDVAAATSLLADFDNDSWQELFIVEPTVGAPIIRRLLGDEIAPVAVDGDITGRLLSATDFDLDGRVDLLVVDEGRWAIRRNVTADVGHHVAVRFRGIDDNNPSSGRVNHYAIGSVVELRFGPHYRAQVITSPTTHFGIDGFDEAGSLRAIFPNGLTQSVRQPPIDVIVEEEQTLKGSCPYLYAWDGEQIRFVTDCLWAAPLGLQVADGVVAKDRPWEYLKVDGDLVRPRDGVYDLRITEELWEIAYVDHVALMAVDHPADVDIWTNEKVGPPEIAKPRIYAFSPSDKLPLQAAQDTRGRDVTAKLAMIDGDFVQGFDQRLLQGLCPPHWIDLDFGMLPEHEPGTEVYLVLTGWILPTDTSLNIQIDQNPDLPAVSFPSVWVPDAAEPEGWREAIPFVGFPGGKTKTIVVDVTDAISRSDPRLRVRTSAQIYWDAAELAIRPADDGPEQNEIVTHDLQLLSAELDYRGFSARINRSPTTPESYDHSQVTTAPRWPPLQGQFTQPGDCLPLLESWDDTMVVMGAGDELRLRFSVPPTDPPAGWKRDFVLHCVGWDKDADLNTLTGQSSLPLPFRDMNAYPPTASQADQAREVESRNRHHLRRTQSFRRFWSR